MPDYWIDPGEGGGSSEPTPAPAPVNDTTTEQIDPSTGAPADPQPAASPYTPTREVYGPQERYGPPAPTPSSSTDNSQVYTAGSLRNSGNQERDTPPSVAAIAAPSGDSAVARTIAPDPLSEAIKAGSAPGGGGAGGGAAMPSIPSAVVSTSPGGGSPAGLILITVGGGILATYLYNKYSKKHHKGSEHED